jgi:hypothetical protein
VQARFSAILDLNKVHFTWDQIDYSRVIKNLPQNFYKHTANKLMNLQRTPMAILSTALRHPSLKKHKRSITFNRYGERRQRTEMSCQPRYKNVTQGTTAAYQLPPWLLYPKGAEMEAVDRTDITRRRKEIPCVGLPISLANRIGYPYSQYFIVRDI